MTSAGPEETHRNKNAIMQKLKQLYPSNNAKLEIFEIASGTGHHVLHFFEAMPWITWTPSDANEDLSLQMCISFRTLQGDATRPSNIARPIRFDVTEPVHESLVGTRKGSFDGVLNINMVHISPWSCSIGLFTSAGYLLKAGGLLIMYGPFAENGVLSPESNVKFDRKLRARNSDWGVRDVKDLIELGQKQKLDFVKLIKMPSNNKLLVFQKV